MQKTYDFIEGRCPVFISMPHSGVDIPAEIEIRMTSSAKEKTDTDWYLEQLYDFAAARGYFLISPIYNRYLIDLNRSEEDTNLYPGQDTTSLCPTSQFDKQSVYLQGKEPDKSEIKKRIEQYWRPYHQKIDSVLHNLKVQFGGAVLFEAHSIKSEVPRFFEGKLADFNFGNNDNRSCSPDLMQSIDEWIPQGYSKVINGRFKGGYITRAYGNPTNNIHSIQLELSQATYMNEEQLSYNSDKAQVVQKQLIEMFKIIDKFASVKLLKNNRR